MGNGKAKIYVLNSHFASVYAYCRAPHNYITLKLPFFDPPTPHHHASSRIITRPPLRYVTPDTDTPLYHLFLFFEVEKKDTQPPMTHPPMFLSNSTKLSRLNKK